MTDLLDRCRGIDFEPGAAEEHPQGRDDILLAFVKDGFVRLAGIMRSGGTSVQAAAAAYLDFALDEPDVYQVMYGLGGVHVPAAATVTEGNAVGAVIADALGTADPYDDRIARIWATAHGLAALHAIRKLPVDRAHLHRLLAASVDDLLHTPQQPEGDAR